MGFTDEEREAMFDRFARAERARAQGIPGLGLGLYATRGIVGAHGGIIDIISAGPGQGSTVEIRLPLLVEEPEA